METRIWRGVGSFLLGGLLVNVVAEGRVSAEIGDSVADGIIGQSSFTDSLALAVGPGTFGKPTGIAIDLTRNRVYVSDSVNNRVLGWSNADALTDGAPADLVIGQPDFLSWGCNRSMDGGKQPVTLESVCGPAGLAVDSAGNLYVVDSDNCRVLIFNDPFGTDQVADAVLGQADGKYGRDESHFYDPMGVAVDAAGNVYVADTLNNRVLEFDDPLTSDTKADRVYGQADFTSEVWPYGVYFPRGVAVDPSGKLYVGSSAYVYEFDNPLGTQTVYHWADRSLGGGGCSSAQETASSTCFPISVATDSAGHLYVADSMNSRVLEVDSPLTDYEAARVFGQADFGPPPGGTAFCGNSSCNAGGPSASSLCLGRYSGSEVSCGLYYGGTVAVDAADRLWVADDFNNRVLRYDNPLGSDAVADLVLGQTTMASIREPGLPLDNPSVGLQEWSYEAIAVDTNNNRVLVYRDLGSTYRETPLAIFGQPDARSTDCNTGGVSAHSLCKPTAAVVANGRLWIADTGNNRVLRFDSPWLSWDYTSQRYLVKRDADQVWGQPDFTSNTCRLGADGLCGPQGLAFDAHGNYGDHADLYISDTGNNRILVDQNPANTTRKAERVYGQPDFNSRDCTPESGGAGKVCDPRGITVLSHIDGWGNDQGDDLYIADRGNNRVVLHQNVYTKPTGADADRVFGQGGNMDAGSCGQGAGGLCHPTAVATDRGGNLLVADTDNNRVIEYTDPLSDITADRVFGQANFTDNLCNAGGESPTAETLCRPAGVATSGAYEGNVLVADSGNNRLLRYEAPYCIESFSLTAANRLTRGIRSKPTRTMLKVKYGSNPSAADDTLEISDSIVLLERDGGIDEFDPPLFTLATDNAFSTGIMFKESVPPWISNVRVTPTGGTWTTDELYLSKGITYYKLVDRFYIPPGFSDAPQRNYINYNARAVGLDLSGFGASHAWFRGQFGSTCFTTELDCAATRNGRRCMVARPKR